LEELFWQVWTWRLIASTGVLLAILRIRISQF
jgi:hypothetical protein